MCKGLVFFPSEDDDLLSTYCSKLAQSSDGEERTPGTDAQNTAQQQRRNQKTLGSVGPQSDSMGCIKKSERSCRFNFFHDLSYFLNLTKN